MEKTAKQPKEDRTMEDIRENDPQFLAKFFSLGKLLMMQIDKRQFDSLHEVYKRKLKEASLDPDKDGGIFAGKDWDIFFAKNEKEDRVLARELDKADFWITPSMSIDFLLELKSISKRSRQESRKIEKAFLKHCNAQDHINLRVMIRSWRKSRYFVPRMKIINDARDAHINHKYTLSIPALIPQIEGILSDLTRKPAGRPGRIFEQTLLERYSDSNRPMSKSIIYKLALGPALYGNIPNEYFTSENYDGWIKTHKKASDLFINRHAILHGVQRNYASESNSLRIFLMLDVLYWMSQD